MNPINLPDASDYAILSISDNMGAQATSRCDTGAV